MVALALPLSGLEIALLVLLVGFGALVVRGVRRRKAFTLPTDPAHLPPLQTDIRVTGKVRRMWRDAAPGLPLVEVTVGARVLALCPTDHAAQAERWRQSIGKKTSLALFGLATLAAGGADAIKDQILDADTVEITPDLLRFLRVGERANDYFSIGRVLSHRSERWEGDPLIVYRLQSAPDLTLEVATPETGEPFSEGQMVHGAVRLFGYLAE